MTIYEKIKLASGNIDELTKTLYHVFFARDDTDICMNCQDPSGTWCTNEYCTNALRKVLTELEYDDV